MLAALARGSPRSCCPAWGGICGTASWPTRSSTTGKRTRVCLLRPLSCSSAPEPSALLARMPSVSTCARQTRTACLDSCTLTMSEKSARRAACGLRTCPRSRALGMMEAIAKTFATPCLVCGTGRALDVCGSDAAHDACAAGGCRTLRTPSVTPSDTKHVD